MGEAEKIARDMGRGQYIVVKRLWMFDVPLVWLKLRVKAWMLKG